MKFSLVTIAVALCSVTQTYGALTFSLRFSNISDSLTNIADETGSSVDGLSWGILIAEDGSDFSSPLLSTVGLSTADGSELLDGYRYFAGGVTTTSVGFEGGEGAVSSSGTIDACDFPEIETGDSFALIWFERGFTSGETLQVGDNYGLLTDASLLVPNAGASLVDYAAAFDGADALRSASLQVIPEPSSVILVALSSLAVLRRRRS